MSRRKRHTPRSLGREEASIVNSLFEELYRERVYSRYWRDPVASATVVAPYPAMETGKAFFSANGSATTLRTFSIQETLNDVLFTDAHAIHSAIVAHVVDVTASSISIEVSVPSGGGNLSQGAGTTASFGVHWVVMGSTP